MDPISHIDAALGTLSLGSAVGACIAARYEAKGALAVLTVSATLLLAGMALTFTPDNHCDAASVPS